jgi:hypothetical protein
MLFAAPLRIWLPNNKQGGDMKAFKNLKTALQPVQASSDQFEAVRSKWIAEVEPLCGGEAVQTVGMFRQGGAAAAQVARRVGFDFGGLGGQALGNSASALARSKRAGGLPQRVLLALTPTRLYAFDYSHQISRKRSERESGKPVEAAVWERSAIRCTAKRSGTMTALTIESPAEGEKATLVGGSASDDPWSQDVISALGATPE